MEAKNAPLLEIEEMFKQFAGSKVLNGIHFSVYAGEVQAVVGGNGAGKSTLMKIITGFYSADRGRMTVKGKRVRFLSTSEAHQHGIYLVPQEPLIFPNMTVEENITIGLPGKKSVLKAKIKSLIKKLGWKLNLEETAFSLSIAEQQLVEIIRGLAREADILILDEPTSTLTFGEIDSLFQTIKRLTNEGIGVIYITHRFSEIFRIADSVSVLRDGVISAQGPVSAFTYERLLASLMPEGAIKENGQESQVETECDRETAPILRLEKLTSQKFHDISFSLFSGEILGVAGVVGAGRTELAQAITGLSGIENGEIILHEKKVQHLSVRERLDQGLIYVPEDRHKHGIFALTSIQSNISSTILHHLTNFFLPFSKEHALATSYIKKFQIKASCSKQEVQNLSGGNQQKVVLSKCLAASPRVIILDEPTRGIDANARKDIYQIIQQLKNLGLAVILISSDMEEIVRLSDRVIVLYEGKLVKRFDVREDITPDNIASFAFGVEQEVGK
ncbi:Autoinducer 2 import ATP-binding protein LsrA [Bacillus sp. THAF10]|uniref:sugar ABC transporter ATP-binding protein n=1 Tax=Bacillus sp. THAF10 TaxID=2587848 RepID=UPI001268A7EF|nr:ATP-binding cassette domain-containing protein [Bacillus sp. THAF10]QFT90754.1 Autoinducer 2 import ATP-binding protein LsrA [Bacillus sp. THAF10]